MITLSSNHALFDTHEAVFISPHYDDICFSIGGIVKQLGRGTLLNLYTRSNYIHLQSPLYKNLYSSPQLISQIRAQEDEQFAKACGLARIDLGLDEPSLSRKDPFRYEDLKDDILELEIQLIPKIQSLTQSNDHMSLLFCPMGIGHHRNHLATTLTILKNRHFLEKYFRLLFYFDLPYAADLRLKMHGLKRFEQLLKSAHLTTYAYALTSKIIEKKQGLIEIYQSQLPTEFIASEYGLQDPEIPELFEAFIQLPLLASN